jgi:hypothetical protein
MDIQAERRKFLAIYRVNGDTLTICYNGDPKKGRPKDFSTEEETNVLMVCKRLKMAK